MNSRPDQPDVLSRLSTLSDLARLRLLSLLSREELSVGELASALQLPQSTVSRHLKVLLDGGWVEKRSAGTASLYRVDVGRLDDHARDLWTLARGQLGSLPILDEDSARLDSVLAARQVDSRAFFGRVAGEWDELRGDLFGSRFTDEALLDLIPPGWTVADLGCGTGDAAVRLVSHVNRLVLIDREPAMLEAARRRLDGCDGVEFLAGDLVDLPLDDGEVDAAILFLVLHHLDDPPAILRSAARIIRPGGVLLVVDMVPHDRADYRQTMGHLHLGFDADTIEMWATQSGFAATRYRRLRPDVHGSGPGLFAARLTRSDVP